MATRGLFDRRRGGGLLVSIDPPTDRGREARRAVLAATSDLLAEGGLGAATVDAIHARSRVSKATIYKYWPNRLCVAVDAFADRLEDRAPLPETDSAVADLVEQVRRVAAFYATPFGRVLVELLAGTFADPEAAALMRQRLLSTRRHAVRELWTRAVTTGEVHGDLDPDVALDVAFGPVMWRLLRGEDVTPHVAADLAEAALRGLECHNGRALAREACQ